MKKKMEAEWWLRDQTHEREGGGRVTQKVVSFLLCPLVETQVRWHVEKHHHV